MNILINDFNLVIADDYLREYAAFDAHKNKGLFPKFGRVRVFEGYQRVFERAQETLTFW